MNETRDQLAHAAVVIIALLPLLLQPHFVTGIWAGLVIGLLAEVKERGSSITRASIRDALGSWKDLGGYSFGGLIIGIVAS